MCRFLIYKGPEMLMSDLLTRSEQSLIRQSFMARERAEPLNGDGFGVGWYVPEIDPVPCVFTSIRPAWSDRNLHRLADKVLSTCFFAHVRAASPGLLVGEANCHPFQFEHYLWMHNGAVADFAKVKRMLRNSLSDHAYGYIQGTTDSEHAFAVFLDRLADKGADPSPDALGEAVRETIACLDGWARDAGVRDASRCNFAVTDGHSIVATRYANGDNPRCESLYVAQGERFENVDGRYRMRPAPNGASAVIIASEPLSDERADWQAVPENHMVVVTPELKVGIRPIA